MDQPLSAQAYLNLLRRSGLVDPERWARLDQVLATGPWAQGPAADDGPIRVRLERLEGRLIADWLEREGWVTAWQNRQLLRGRYRGFVLGKYVLLDHLGTGGMSSVYRARHRLLERLVALKLFDESSAESRSQQDRFLREAQAAAQLHHPHLMRAYDIGRQGSTQYIALQYIQGETLSERVQRTGPLDWSEVAYFLLQAAAGLQVAHQHRIVHRDVKPANLLVDRQDQLYVLDLGLVRRTDESPESITLAHSEKVMGTADYLAPEQARNCHDVDHRADLYALGCTFHFLATGRAPFAGATLAERVWKHQQAAPPRLSESREDVPEVFERLLQQALAKLPAERPSSIALWAAPFASWLTHQREAMRPAWRTTLQRLQYELDLLAPPVMGGAIGTPNSDEGVPDEKMFHEGRAPRASARTSVVRSRRPRHWTWWQSVLVGLTLVLLVILYVRVAGWWP